MIFEPADFVARLAALVPKPRAHLTRYHGLFAPASPDRAQIVPRTRAAAATERGEAAVTDRQRAMSWVQRLKWLFAIDRADRLSHLLHRPGYRAATGKSWLAAGARLRARAFPADKRRFRRPNDAGPGRLVADGDFDRAVHPARRLT